MIGLLSSITDTIVAVATPPGVGALGIIRVSGKGSYDIVQKLFPSKDLNKQSPNTLHVGYLKEEGKLIDEVVLSLFKAPHSFTGEDSIEISCHGSPYILQKVLDALVRAGARLAGPGEYSQRAFLNGKMDLAQAEAVADVISAETEAAHKAALNQMRGGFSNELNQLRERLIHFLALIELELDFSDEDVAFADRSELKKLIDEVLQKTTALMDSFALGNVIKKGVSVAIIGKPNAGKSTLLNALLNEERAIVSDIAGTTRDTVEETINIKGILFRLIDTAGVRDHSTDYIENLGIARSKENAAKADIIIHVLESGVEEPVPEWMEAYPDKIITVYNKWDVYESVMKKRGEEVNPTNQAISAKTEFGIDVLRSRLFKKAINNRKAEGSIVTNARHYEALKKVRESLLEAKNALEQNISGDLLAVDVRRALYYIGEITGQVEVDRDILGTIFSKFCIGK